MPGSCIRLKQSELQNVTAAAALLPNVLAALGCCCSVAVRACCLWLSEARGRVHGL